MGAASGSAGGDEARGRCSVNVDTDDLLLFDEACAFLRIGRQKLSRLVKTGEIKGHRLRGTWRFWRSDLRKAIRPTEAIPWPCKQEEVQG